MENELRDLLKRLGDIACLAEASKRVEGLTLEEKKKEKALMDSVRTVNFGDGFITGTVFYLELIHKLVLFFLENEDRDPIGQFLMRDYAISMDKKLSALSEELREELGHESKG